MTKRAVRHATRYPPATIPVRRTMKALEAQLRSDATRLKKAEAARTKREREDVAAFVKALERAGADVGVLDRSLARFTGGERHRRQTVRSPPGMASASPLGAIIAGLAGFEVVPFLKGEMRLPPYEWDWTLTHQTWIAPGTLSADATKSDGHIRVDLASIHTGQRNTSEAWAAVGLSFRPPGRGVLVIRPRVTVHTHSHLHWRNAIAAASGVAEMFVQIYQIVDDEVVVSVLEHPFAAFSDSGGGDPVLFPDMVGVFPTASGNPPYDPFAMPLAVYPDRYYAIWVLCRAKIRAAGWYTSSFGYNYGSDAAAVVDVKVHSVTLQFVSLVDLIVAGGVAIQS